MEDIIHNGIERKEVKTTRKHTESLSAVNNAVKILTPMLAAAGCDSKIQLLTAKSLYEKADVTLPIMIEADQQYLIRYILPDRLEFIIRVLANQQIRQ